MGKFVSILWHISLGWNIQTDFFTHKSGALAGMAGAQGDAWTNKQPWRTKDKGREEKETFLKKKK